MFRFLTIAISPQNQSLPQDIKTEPIQIEEGKAEVKIVYASSENQSSHQGIKDAPMHKEIDEAKPEVKEVKVSFDSIFIVASPTAAGSNRFS